MTITQAGWGTLFDDFHRDEQGAGGFAFAGFDAQSGEVIGRRQHVRGYGSNSEATTITLVHTPVQP